MRIAAGALAYGGVMALAVVLATVALWSGNRDALVAAAVFSASAVLLVASFCWACARLVLGLIGAKTAAAHASAGALAAGVPLLLVSLLDAYGPTPPLTMALALFVGVGAGLAAHAVERRLVG